MHALNECCLRYAYVFKYIFFMMKPILHKLLHEVFLSRLKIDILLNKKDIA